MSSNCVPCSGLNPNDLIPIEQLQRRITELLPLWTIHESGERNSDDMINNADANFLINYYSINRKFTAKNFQSAMTCLNEIGRIAEEQNHHPDLHITNYRDVHIELYTHKLNGVTENDIILAHAIDTKVSIEYSPKWLKNHPEISSTT
jgi:4a-hydroxytetrahydrobiopterin dehydratase